IARRTRNLSGRNSAIGMSRMSGGTGRNELSAKAMANSAHGLKRCCDHAATCRSQPPRATDASMFTAISRGRSSRRAANVRRKPLPECNQNAAFRKQPFGLVRASPLEIGRAGASTCRQSPTGREETMRGLMCERPLLISGILEHAARFHADTEIVSRLVDGSIHRYTYAEADRRSRQLAQALLRLGIKPRDPVATIA